MSFTNKKKILIVDDEKPIRTILTRYLEKAGYQCQDAESVPAARELLAKEHFDLLITDLMMPGETGLSLIKHAKKHYPKTGRIMATAMGSQDTASEIMEVGVYGYIVKPISRDIVLITVENALRHLALDIDVQACISEMEEKISYRTKKLDAIMSNLNIGIVMVDTDMKILEMNRQMKEWHSTTGASEGKQCFQVLVNPDRVKICDECPMATTFQEAKTCDVERQLKTARGKRDFRIVTTPIINEDGQVYAAVGLYEDVTERLMIERDLHQAQKLEAVGQLAAGIAHEINTPIQYVGDNLSFLKDSFTDIYNILGGYDKIWQAVKDKDVISQNLQEQLEADIEEADLKYLTEEVPLTIDQSLDGVRRVDKIVRAMKDFSHPGEEEKTPTDLNKIIETALTVCRNEWKYVAEIETNLASDLSAVPCYPGDISQVFLNLIVNAAHAIGEETDNGNNGLGKITISTQADDENATVRITDTGGGIPEEIQGRVFNPFFTTKKRGKGTGQGLAIAHRVVVNKHEGHLSFDSKKNGGTTFFIQLPLL